MACTPQEIAALLPCLQSLAPRQTLAAWAVIICGGAPPPPAGDRRITEEGGLRKTEEGDQRITE